MNGLEKRSIEACANGYRMTMRHQAVTPELAKFWLENYDYEGQRSLRKTNLLFLEKEMRNDSFLPNSMLVFWVKNNVAELLDGRHRLNSVVESGKTEFFWIQTIFNDSSSTGIVYSVIDTGSARSSKDGLKALKTEIPQQWLGQTSTVGAIRRIESGFAHVQEKNNALEIDALLRDWTGAINLYGESIRGGALAHRYMRMSRLQAAGMITCRWQPVLAQHFWNGISYDDGLKQDDPRKHIAKNIVDDNHPLRHLGSRHERTSGLILAYLWNKFFRGETVKRICIPSADSPIIFEGTPYNTALPNCGIIDKIK